MSHFDVDFNDQETMKYDGSYYAVDAKDQRLKIINVDDITRDADKPCVKVTFECIWGEHLFRRATQTYYFNEKARWRPRKVHLACGYYTTKKTDSGKEEQHVIPGTKPSQWMGKIIVGDINIVIGDNMNSYTEVTNEREYKK